MTSGSGVLLSEVRISNNEIADLRLTASMSKKDYTVLNAITKAPNSKKIYSS